LVANGATWTSLTSSNLSFNHAALDGGAFNVTGGATVLVNNSLVGNRVEGRGGAISYAHQCFAPSEFLRSSKSTQVCLFVSMLVLYPHGLAWPTCHQYLHQYLLCSKTVHSICHTSISARNACCICLPCASVLHESAGATSQNFAWASGNQALASAAGVCSIIMSTGDSINNNSAMAGGAMYSSDMTTTWINCSFSPNVYSQHSGCLAWSENTVPQGTNPGYGPVLAFPPSKMVVTPTSISSYTSNGSALMPLTIQIQDEAATFVSSGDKVHASSPCQQLACA